MNTLLPTVWFLILCFEIALYVMLDGGDLGIGILSLFPQSSERRSLMMYTIGPIWDANETWLVIAGGTLFGAFPLAYSSVLNALYIPVMMILFGLILRAVSLEFAEYTHMYRPLWEKIFGLSSLLAVVGQGCAVGGLLGGIAITNDQFAGGALSWVSPLTFFVTIGILCSYVVVGYAYLIKKADYVLQGESFIRILVAAIATFASLSVAALLLPQMQYIFFTRWLTPPTNTFLAVIGFCIALVSFFLVRDTYKKQNQKHLYTMCMCIFALSLIGIIIGVYPYLIPPTVTIQDAAASPATLRFMLWGIGPLLPIVLAYNWYLYKVFSK
ncbi:MAG TPA: cytochrome d ubiquinol oxidase subunit II [Candidatus Paceibacterota bacterium]